MKLPANHKAAVRAALNRANALIEVGNLNGAAGLLNDTAEALIDYVQENKPKTTVTVSPIKSEQA